MLCTPKRKQNVSRALISLTSGSAPADFIYAQHREGALLNKLRLEFDWPCLSFLLLWMFSQGIQFIFGKGSLAVYARLEQPQGIEQLAGKEVKTSPCVEGSPESTRCFRFWFWLPTGSLPPSSCWKNLLSTFSVILATVPYSLGISRHACPQKHISQTKLGLYALCGD